MEVRLTPDEKQTIERLSSRCGMTASQIFRAYLALDVDPAADEKTVIVFDKETAPLMWREMRKWGYHYNQAVHALNRLAFYAERGKIRDGMSAELLQKANEELAQVNAATAEISGKVDEILGYEMASI